jgi:hypothetical protein
MSMAVTVLHELTKVNRKKQQKAGFTLPSTTTACIAVKKNAWHLEL